MGLRYCKAPGCHNLTASGYCPAHRYMEKRENKHKDKRRPNSSRRGYDGQWQKVRKYHLREHPICQKCRRRLARQVHHIEPISKRPDLVYAEWNLMSVCRQCHAELHRRDRGGMGTNSWYRSTFRPKRQACVGSEGILKKDHQKNQNSEKASWATSNE